MENLIKADVIDYLGKHEMMDSLGRQQKGVLVLLSIDFNGSFFEGTLFYSDVSVHLTVDESIEEQLGHQIEFWDGYRDLLISILKRVVPYDEIINRLDEVDFAKYFGEPDIDDTEGEDVDDEEIKK